MTMLPLASSQAVVEPPSRDLDLRELRRLAWRLGMCRTYWEPHVRLDSQERHCVRLHSDPHLDVWLICWSGEQDTGLHDHDVSSGAVHVCQGDLVEDRLEVRGEVVRRVAIARPFGCTFDFDAAHVHCVRHDRDGSPAVSIHVYSPALVRMGYYEVGGDGLLRRRAVAFDDELTAA